MVCTIPKRKPRVIYWNNIPAPYIVERFNVLADLGTLDFEAWFNDRIHSDRSWHVDESSWRFRYRYMPTVVIAGRPLHFPLPLLKRNRPDLLVSLYAEPSFLFGWAIAKLRGIKAGFWVVLTFNRWVQRTALKEAFKRWLFPKVDAIITTGRDGRDFAKRYGALQNRIFFAPHGIDVKHFRQSSTAAALERESLRDEVGAVGTTFIYVGRIWRGKGLDYLLDAFKQVQRRSESEVSLLLVGDGADEQSFRHKCKAEDIRNVIFAGFNQKAELPRFYAAADVFVFPTLGDPYGLVVDEAMACSLPIISTCAAGEISHRVEEGVNGYIVPPENSDGLAEAMLKLVGDESRKKRMGSASAEKIAGHTSEKWAEDFERIVFEILKEDP